MMVPYRNDSLPSAMVTDLFSLVIFFIHVMDATPIVRTQLACFLRQQLNSGTFL